MTTMNLNSSTFLRKITEKIKKGDYDKYFTVPFMSQDLLIASVKNKLFKKMTKGVTPILTDSEIMLCIQEVKETAVNIFSIFLQSGIIEKSGDGTTYEISKKGKIAIKQSSLMFMLK